MLGRSDDDDGKRTWQAWLIPRLRPLAFAVAMFILLIVLLIFEQRQ